MTDKLQYLQKGDTVDIIAPASGKTEAEYKAAIALVKEFGLEPRVRSYDSLIKPGLCANSVEYRYQHLMEALESDSKAVWCLGGGYGSGKLLEKLTELVNPPREKLFIGFSDITMLLNYFAEFWGWTTIHGPMPGQVGTINQSSWDSLAEVIFGKVDKVKFAAKPLNQAANMPGLVQGKFFGGCLSLMQTFIGTAEMPSLPENILFLEDDRFETPRRIDRILDHMDRTGMFYEVGAVVLGNFLENGEEGTKNATSQDAADLNEILAEWAEKLNERGIPLLQNTKLGHSEDMQTVLIGAYAEIKLGVKPEVVISNVSVE